ncbi:barttin isoform X2 [Ornithorhynchus anatinus]|uniref:barttin isoform X2 n=1 Tax=Ornithorhynchus anatinus TaxID=9258 RepID=UPI0019D494CF|nr:barttin isoform X2 [Ornithorhynchus anatinus]
MAEDASFRPGLIVLGAFLVAVGMFIMSTDRPQVYITFCAVGVGLVAVGVVWSLCRCYPKVTFVPADSDFEALLAQKLPRPPETRPQQPYAWLEEEARPAPPPIIFHHLQLEPQGSGGHWGGRGADRPDPCEPGDSGAQRSVQASVEVHQGPDGSRRWSQGPAEDCWAAPTHARAPLASFLDDEDVFSSLESRCSHAGLPPPRQPTPDLYGGFALIDAKEEVLVSPAPLPGPGPAGDPAATQEGGPEEVGSGEKEEGEDREEDGDLFYGLRDGDVLVDGDSDLELDV